MAKYFWNKTIGIVVSEKDECPFLYDFSGCTISEYGVCNPDSAECPLNKGRVVVYKGVLE